MCPGTQFSHLQVIVILLRLSLWMAWPERLAFPGLHRMLWVFSDTFHSVWLELAGLQALRKLRLLAGLQLCPGGCLPSLLWSSLAAVRLGVGRLQWDPCVDWQRVLSPVPFPANQQPSASLNSDLCLLSSVRAPALLGPFPASGAESASQVEGLVLPVGCLSGAQASTSHCLMTGASWTVQWPLVDGGRPLGCILVPPGQKGGFYPWLFIVSPSRD